MSLGFSPPYALDMLVLEITFAFALGIQNLFLGVWDNYVSKL